MQTFRAIRVHQEADGITAPIENITLDDLADGEVVIRAAWSGVNYKDALACTGKGKIMRSFPMVAGIDVSGVVESSTDSRFEQGMPVLVTGSGLGEERDGGFAERVRVPADSVVPLPKGLSLREAMVIGTAGFTAGIAVRRMLDNHQSVENGPIAVTGPTGGVGSVAIDILSQLGFEVHALTRKPEQGADYLRGLGASEIVDTTALELGTRPLEKTRWGGAVDNVGGDLAAWLSRTIRPWGNLASVGLAASHELNTTVMPFILRGVSLLGIHSVHVPPALRDDVWQQLAGPWRPRSLDRIAAHEATLDELPEVFEATIRGDRVGRTIVRIGGD